MAINVLLVLLALSGCSSGGTASASCVSPSLVLSPAPARPAAHLTLSARYFTDGCADTVTNGASAPTPRSARDLTVRLVQGAHSWLLAEHVQAGGQLSAFSIGITIPKQAAAGTAQLVVGTYRQEIHLDPAAAANTAGTEPASASPTPSSDPHAREVTAAVRQVQSWLNVWVREGPAVASRYLVPAQRLTSSEGPSASERLVTATVSSSELDTWTSPDDLTLLVTLDLHFAGGEGWGAWGDGRNTRFVHLTRSSGAAAYLLDVSTGPPSGPPSCADAALKLGFGPLFSEPTGAHTVEVDVTNVSPATCQLSGYPAISMRDAAGRELPVSYTHEGDQVVTSAAPGTVILAPGGSALFLLDKYRCDLSPAAPLATLDVLLPGGARVRHMDLTSQGRLVDWCGNDPNVVAVSPVEATMDQAVRH